MYDHIVEYRRPLMILSDHERRSAAIQDVWVPSERWSLVKNVAQTILAMPLKTQTLNLLVYGIGGVGKTSMFERLIHLFGQQPGSSIPCIASMTLKSETGHKAFRQQVFETLTAGMSFSPGNDTDAVMIRAARAQNIRAIAIDEINNITLAPKADVQKNLALLKGLGAKASNISVWGFGDDRAFHALSSDKTLARRFEKILLQPWTETEGFRSWVSGIEATLPLKKPSSLTSKNEIKFLLKHTEGITDFIVKLINNAAIWAIVEGVEKVNLDMLKLAHAEMPPASPL